MPEASQAYPRRADLDGAGRLSNGPSHRWPAQPAGSPIITGVVRSQEGRIRLKIHGPQARGQEVEAIVDTGFTASLTLPPALISALGLRWQTVESFTLADGSECIFDVYVAKVEWDGKVRTILVDEADADPLVGMRLLRGCELKMQIRSRGKVTIKRLPKK